MAFSDTIEIKNPALSLYKRLHHGIEYIITEYQDTFALRNICRDGLASGNCTSESSYFEVTDVLQGTGVLCSYILQLLCILFLGYWLLVAVTTICALWMTLNGSLFQDFTVLHHSHHQYDVRLQSTLLKKRSTGFLCTQHGRQVQ